MIFGDTKMFLKRECGLDGYIDGSDYPFDRVRNEEGRSQNVNPSCSEK
jgi:hypothetical protein